VLLAALVTCVAVLAYYKYDRFLLGSLGFAAAPATAGATRFVPLGISFFAFEFVHYLTDRRRGEKPVTRLVDFLCFGLFWPTMVAGPIKRYEQFLPALEAGVAGASLDDLARGLGRVGIGLAKKWAADNLTGWIAFFETQYATATPGLRWVFLVALAARILLDFSGYSDMAIGFARMLGIKVPENFNWPYLARSPSDFWRRWHISLSSWIRDYVYIPLGGNRLGPVRRVANGLAAMALCGLWHGPDWHFVAWGVYHGLGLAAGATIERGWRRYAPATGRAATVALGLAGWAVTMLFVGLGWLLFFYPVGRALEMAGQLFGS
jgi:alginate O-acetyltransferase complex protein AlgI